MIRFSLNKKSAYDQNSIMSFLRNECSKIVEGLFTMTWFMQADSYLENYSNSKGFSTPTAWELKNKAHVKVLSLKLVIIHYLILIKYINFIIIRDAQLNVTEIR